MVAAVGPIGLYWFQSVVAVRQFRYVLFSLLSLSDPYRPQNFIGPKNFRACPGLPLSELYDRSGQPFLS